MLYRWMEIGHDGMAFHNTDLGGHEAPQDVHYCDCRGVGLHSFNPLAQRVHLDRRQTKADTIEEWKAAHVGPKHQIRRQIFVDLDSRSDIDDWQEFEAQFRAGRLKYDETSDRFIVIDPIHADAT